MRRAFSFTVAFLLIAAAVSYAFNPVMATTGAGNFALDLNGYMLNGNLQNAIVRGNGVSMVMVLNGNIPTSVGQVPVSANGVWVGTRNGTSVAGSIQGVSGTVSMCILFWCGHATFIGQGQWSGTLTGTVGAGAYEGTITFVNSDFSQIHTNQPAPISGTWNADFQQT